MEKIIIDKIVIDGTDIFLEDEGNGAGKLIISNTYGYNYSTYWGAMGDKTLSEFISGLDMGYFVNRLIPPSDRGEFSGKLSVRNVRNYIREEMKWDLPWYKFMEPQKDLRRTLKKLERCESDRDFVDVMSRLSKDVDTWGLNRWEEKEFIEVLESLECEPWHFIVMGPSQDTIFLEKLFKKLQKELKKSC